MSLKKLFLSVAVIALMLSLAQTASAQSGGGSRLRLKAFDIFPADGGRIAGNSNYDERENIPRKIEVQVQNVRSTTTSMDAYVVDGNTFEFVYFATFPVVNGIGRVEHEIERNEFVPRVRLWDYIFLFDSATYDWMGWGFYSPDGN